MIAKSIRVVALGVFLAAAVAGSAQAVQPCGVLLVSAERSKTPMVLDGHSVKCKHGKHFGALIGDFRLEQSHTRGPDCTMTFHERKRRPGHREKRYSTIRVQQNFCGLGAGKITVQMHLGAAVKYVKKEGSFAKKKPGKIFITDFK